MCEAWLVNQYLLIYVRRYVTIVLELVDRRRLGSLLFSLFCV